MLVLKVHSRNTSGPSRNYSRTIRQESAKISPRPQPDGFPEQNHDIRETRMHDLLS